MEAFLGSKILVGVDGSPNAVTALAWAVDEARRQNTDIEAVYAYQVPAMAYSAPGYIPPNRAEMERVGRRILDDALSSIDLEEVRVDLRVVEDPPLAVLVDAASQPDVALVVVGARGHGGVAGLLLGSVSHGLTHHCPKPLAVIPAGWSGSPSTDRVVVGVDGSDGSARALAWAVEEARRSGDVVEAVMVCPPPSPTRRPHGPVGDAGAERLGCPDAPLLRVLDSVAHHGVTVERRMMMGSPAAALIEAAGPARMLVVGARGIGRAHELVSGSVSHACTHRAQVPVVVVRPDR